jgi:hypothetical protein
MNVLGRLQRTDERMGLMRRMVVTLEKQLEIVPEDVRARILLAGQYAELPERAEDAIRQLQTAVALRSDSNVLITQRASAPRQEGTGLKLPHSVRLQQPRVVARDPDLNPTTIPSSNASAGSHSAVALALAVAARFERGDEQPNEEACRKRRALVRP